MHNSKSFFLNGSYIYIALTLVIALSAPALSNAAEASDQYSVFFASIKQYAELSNASYSPEKDIKEEVVSQGDELVHYGYLQQLQIRYFLTINKTKKTHTVVIRGTSNLENALTGFDIKLAENGITGTRIHNGFAKAASAVLNEIEPLLDRSYKISLTGHSLGGAVAQVLAMYLNVNGYETDHVITFGQPKVTNITGTLKFRNLNIIRVVTPHDMVPLIPPLDPMDINDLDIYWHAGKEVILLENKDFSLINGVESMLRATKIFDTQVSEKNLTLHKMSEYLALVSNKLDEPNEIPYENDFRGIRSLLGY